MRAKIYNATALSAADKKAIARALDDGAVAVFPTDTVYGIGTGAFCEASITRICVLKNRPLTQPFQLLAASVAQVAQVSCLEEGAVKLAHAFWPGGLTLIVRPNEKGRPLARGFAGLGFRVPSCAVLTDILAEMKYPLASTSANLHGQPVLTDEREVIHTFSSKADIIIEGGTLGATASSVVNFAAGKNPVLVREGAVSKKQLEETLGVPFVTEENK
jgi:L-threonylcarbamoyladenylate synthase